jgi:hypothetical protein
LYVIFAWSFNQQQKHALRHVFCCLQSNGFRSIWKVPFLSF